MRLSLRKIINIIDILLLILCMMTIFYLSSENAVKSLETTNKVTTKAYETVTDKNASIKEDKKEIDNFIENNLKLIRKSAHFLEYMLLGFLMFNVLKDYRKVSVKLGLISLFLSFLYSCSDEIHQMFIPNRTALLVDVLIDSLGSLLGVFIFFGLYNFIIFIKNRQNTT